MLGKDEHCSAGRRCQLPPSLLPSVPLARPPALPLLLRRIREREEGRKPEEDAVADAATACRGEGTEEGGGPRREEVHSGTKGHEATLVPQATHILFLTTHCLVGFEDPPQEY